MRFRVVRGGVRVVATGVAGLSVLAVVGPASATSVPGLACRTEIAKQTEALQKLGFSLNDKCHQKQDKLGGTGDPAACNSVTSAEFDPPVTLPKPKPLKYQETQKTKMVAAITKKCLAGDPQLKNYPADDPTGNLFPIIDAAIEAGSFQVVGTTNQGGDKYRNKCIEEVGKQRSKITDLTLKNAIKCQLGKDKLKASFGAGAAGLIDPSCITAAVIDPLDVAKTKAEASITAKCVDAAKAPITGDTVGSCTTLPTCVTAAGRAAGIALAQQAYHLPTCGDGLLEGSEQCDDGNLTAGDGCNASCESEVQTCSVSPALANSHRKVTISVTTPSPLAGVRIDLAYPLFQSSIPGFGSSSEVQNRVTELQSGGLTQVNDDDLKNLTIATASVSNFISSGPLYEVLFDNCVALSRTFCNRTKNVLDCSLAPKRCTCAAAADCSTGAPHPAGSCPTTGTSHNLCAAGNAERQSCTADTDCASGQTCQLDPAGFSNDPVCSPGHFPTLVDNIPPFLVGTEIGPGDGSDFCPAGGCPGDNVCVHQADATACTASGAVDENGTPIDGVVCTVSVTELP